jgi:hypothetical protein
MEINLRKANAIQAEIRKAISAVKMNSTVELNEFTADVVTAMDEASAAYGAGVTRKVALTTALYNIRNSVASVNAVAGINTLLGDIEALEQVMAIHSGVANLAVAKSYAEVTARIEKLKAAPQDARSSLYGDSFRNVDTSVVRQSDIDVAKNKVKDLKRQRQAMQDKLLSLNVNTLISIKPDDEALLKDEGII